MPPSYNRRQASIEGTPAGVPMGVAGKETLLAKHLPPGLTCSGHGAKDLQKRERKPSSSILAPVIVYMTSPPSLKARRIHLP